MIVRRWRVRISRKALTLWNQLEIWNYRRNYRGKWLCRTSAGNADGAVFARSIREYLIHLVFPSYEGVVRIPVCWHEWPVRHFSDVFLRKLSFFLSPEIIREIIFPPDILGVTASGLFCYAFWVWFYLLQCVKIVLCHIKCVWGAGSVCEVVDVCVSGCR